MHSSQLDFHVVEFHHLIVKYFYISSKREDAGYSCHGDWQMKKQLCRLLKAFRFEAMEIRHKAIVSFALDEIIANCRTMMKNFQRRSSNI